MCDELRDIVMRHFLYQYVLGFSLFIDVRVNIWEKRPPYTLWIYALCLSLVSLTSIYYVENKLSCMLSFYLGVLLD